MNEPLGFDFNKWLKVLEELSKKMPDEAIQRTRKSETKKGYDTDGYGYQFCVDRFNTVLGIFWGYEFEICHHIEGQYKSGSPFHEVTVVCKIWCGTKDFVRMGSGGHTSSNYSDALKGASTNAFKKTASFWGVGRDAYAGTIDDDNHALPESDFEKTKSSKETKTLPENEVTIDDLPESIKNHFRSKMYSRAKVTEVCEKFNYDFINLHDAITKGVI